MRRPTDYASFYAQFEDLPCVTAEDLERQLAAAEERMRVIREAELKRRREFEQWDRPQRGSGYAGNGGDCYDTEWARAYRLEYGG